MERFKDRRPSVGESKKRPVARLVVASLIVLGGTFGAEAATGGAVSKMPGNVAQVGKEMLKKGANAVVEWDNHGWEASSAGIPAQKLGDTMKQRDEADQARKQQAAQDKIDSEALRQALNPGPKQFP